MEQGVTEQGVTEQGVTEESVTEQGASGAQDGDAPRIVGSRSLPCHGQRAARLVVTDKTLVRTCSLCRAKFEISFVEEPRLGKRLGMRVYSPVIVPWVDRRTKKGLAREAERAEASPTLPFGDTWRELRG